MYHFLMIDVRSFLCWFGSGACFRPDHEQGLRRMFITCVRKRFTELADPALRSLSIRLSSVEKSRPNEKPILISGRKRDCRVRRKAVLRACFTLEKNKEVRH